VLDRRVEYEEEEEEEEEEEGKKKKKKPSLRRASVRPSHAQTNLQKFETLGGLLVP